MRNILLTGGSGFIGKNIRESYLTGKYNIIAPTHSELDLLNENMVREFFFKNNVDIVIHSACKPGHRNAKNPTNIFYTNSRMFFNLARNSSLYEKMIVLASGAVYDTKFDISRVEEDYFDTHIPEDEHGFQKYIAAKHIEQSNNIVELRIFGIFGKYEDYTIRFISNAICKTIHDLPITIKQDRKLDYIFVNDLIPVLDYFIQNENIHKAYNVSSDEALELYKLAEKIIRISGKDLPIIVGNNKKGLEYSGDNSRMKNEIDSLKFTPIDEAIKELYSWYLENIELINKEYLLFDK